MAALSEPRPENDGRGLDPLESVGDSFRLDDPADLSCTIEPPANDATTARDAAVIAALHAMADGDLSRLPDGKDILSMAVRHLAARLGATRSEEHTSELQSLMRISYAAFCLKKTKLLSLLLHSVFEYLITPHPHTSK